MSGRTCGGGLSDAQGASGRDGAYAAFGDVDDDGGFPGCAGKGAYLTGTLVQSASASESGVPLCREAMDICKAWANGWSAAVMAGRASGVRAGVGTTLSAVTSVLPSERRKGERQGRLRLGRSGRAEVRMRETPRASA